MTSTSLLNPYRAALDYAARGFSVLPCRGKQPALANWLQLQERPAKADTVALWNRSRLFGNVGIVCGRVSGNLVVIDCDGDSAVEAYRARFWPVLTDTWTVQSGSGRGAHFYYRVDDLPATARLLNAPFGGNVELRSNGSYVVAPPSIHPDTGRPYTVLSDAPILRVQHLRGVLEWLRDQSPKRAAVAAPSGEPTPVKFSSAYGRAALAGECAAVRMAPVNSRNNQLYRSALKLGSLVADGRLDRATAERELRNAASGLAQTDGDMSVIRTIASGLDKGEESSRAAFTNAKDA